jgi:hypothetical protein
VADDKRASNPGTEPFVPDFEDTGTRGFVPDFSDDEDTGTRGFVPDFSDDEDTGTRGFVPDFSDDDDTGSHPVPVVAKKPGKAEDDKAATEMPAASERDAGAEPAGASVQSVTVPGRYQYLRWWKLLLVMFGVWAVTAEVGLSLFYWWYHSIDKTPAVFMVLVYVVACTVGGVMLAMVPGRPLISALSIAVLSGPFGSVVAAAPLYGYYYCERMGHCLIDVIPY